MKEIVKNVAAFHFKTKCFKLAPLVQVHQNDHHIKR